MKSIIITGCSSGFGLLMTKQLATEGNMVYATMRNVKTSNYKAAEELNAWAKENKANIIITELDVSNEQSIQIAIAEIARLCNGKIDVLINNAGFGSIGLVEEFDVQQKRDLFETMVFGPDNLIRAVLPYMHQHKSGLLILIASRMSAFQLPFMGMYSAAKAAIHSIAKSYSYELKHLCIDSVVLQAGSFPTAIASKYLTAEKEEVAKNYGDWYVKAKNKIIDLFTKHNQPQSVQLLTDLVSTIINTPQGKRKMVYPVGLGVLEAPINEINLLAENISATLINKMEI